MTCPKNIVLIFCFFYCISVYGQFHFLDSITPPPLPEGIEAIDTLDYATVPFFPGCEQLSIDERRTCTDHQMMEFIRKHLIYPEQAKLNQVKGTVLLRFTIEKDGKIKIIKIVKSLGYGCDEEAKRVMALMPQFVYPIGSVQGAKLRQITPPIYYNIPIEFGPGT